jgi:S1-C subfamily serine protease
LVVRLLRALGPLLTAAVLGGGVAVAAVALLGGLERSTTVVTETLEEPSPARTATSGTMSVNEIYQRSAPGVVRVNVTSTSTAASDPLGGASPSVQTLGSGFVIDKAGHIVTNYHVVRDAGRVTVSFSNRDSVRAKVVGTDPSTDIAVLQVETAASALTPLSLGDSDHVLVGDPVVAIGNPFGLDRTATSGIVSALQRFITAPNEFTIDHVIQTDAPINHGNSGGPLIDAHGKVIGVNTQIETGDSASGNVGIGFAVPSNTVKDVVAQILSTGHVNHAFLGIVGQALTPSLAEKYNLATGAGVLVESVSHGSGADDAGLRGGTTRVVDAGETYVLGGDIIVTVDGQKITSIEQLRDVVAAHEPGDRLQLTIYRQAKRTSMTVTLGRQPSSPQG